MAIDWQMQRGLLVSDLTRQINRASVQVRGAHDPLLDYLATLQSFKRALLRAENSDQYLALADQWRDLDQTEFKEL
jgi:hypothetical protein